MKKADWKLIFAAAACCVLLFLARGFWLSGKNEAAVPDSTENTDSTEEESETEAAAGAGYVVVVKKNGSLFGTYPLDEDQTVVIGDTNILLIEDGSAWMAYADCPDQYCIMQGEISSPGPMIVCLPNRVTVQVERADTEAESGSADTDSEEMTDEAAGTEISGQDMEEELDAVAG